MHRFSSITTGIRDALRPMARWVMHGKSAGFLLFWIGVFDLILWTGFDITGQWHQNLLNLGAHTDDDRIPDITALDVGYALYMRTLARLGICLAPAFLAWILRRRAAKPYPVLPVAMASLWLCLITLSAAAYHGLPQAMAGSTGDEPYTTAFCFGLVLTALAFFLPPLCIWLYRRGTVLDRYVARSFLIPFLLCLVGFISIWLISDMANNGSDFTAGNFTILDIAALYVMQLPEVLVLVLPITLLLGLLYALGQMSRRNELVSMMMAGRSVPRILLPVFLIGAMATLVSLICNYQWAPSAAGSAAAAIESAAKKKKSRYSAYDQCFVNRAQNRIWFVGRYPEKYSRDNKLETVVVAEFDARNVLRKTRHADKAYWKQGDKTWVFWDSQTTDFNDKGEPVSVAVLPDKSYVQGWDETPWRIVSAGLNPEFLGLPQLGACLQAYRDAPAVKLAPFRTHWQHRLALPLGCFTIVLIGAPLGIVYSRRGLVGSATAAVVLFFASLFVTSLFVALGQSHRLPTVPAVWTPPALFAAIGFWLLHLRGQNRELPTLRGLLAKLRPVAQGPSRAGSETSD